MPAPAQEPVPTLCRVDLLIFRHTTTSAEQINDILNVPPHPGDSIQASVELFPSSSEKQTNGEDNRAHLIPGENKLSVEIEKLGRSEKFELLHQVSWQQPVYDPQNALYISLIPERRHNLLKGTLKLSYERYFQFAITLLYEPGFADLEPSEQESPESSTVFIHLKEVMTDNKLYYLDHPLLGVLARITVLETAAPGDAGL